MIKKYLVALLLLFAATPVFSQTAWWVFLTDKHNSTFDPQTYFAPEALTRRQLNPQAATDSTDYPVSQNYIAQLSKCVDTVGYASRWLNAVSVVATPEQIAHIQQFPFVRSVQEQHVWTLPVSCAQPHALLPDTIKGDTIVESEMGDYSPGQQLRPLQGQLFYNAHHRGKGIVIAVLDVGFYGVDVHEAFEDLRFNNRIRSTFDFVNNSWNVYKSKEAHGTMVLSCLGGMMHGAPMGLATEATYLLARISKPYGNQYRGEERWVQAMEWADQQGANIINSSGGPNERSYFQEQMDGKTPVISRAAKLAAKKGILVVSAAGNNGEYYEPYILPPADADSTVSVAATGADNLRAEYSSYGPTADFRRKPDVSAPGTAVVASGNSGFEVDEGTSFSCPLVAGFAACLMEMYPDSNVMAVYGMINRSGSLYPYYDYSHGYGIPQATAFIDSVPAAPRSFDVQRDSSSLITIKTYPSLSYCESGKFTQLFWNITDERGRIIEYHVVELEKPTTIKIDPKEYHAGYQLNISYNHYYEKLVF